MRSKDYMEMIDRVQFILNALSESKDEQEDIKFMNSLVTSKGLLTNFDANAVEAFGLTE